MNKSNNSWFGSLRNLFGIFTITLIVFCTLSYLFPGWGWKIPEWLKDIYLKILIGTITLKEGLRWLGYDRGKKIMRGGIYVTAWIVLTIGLGVISTIWPERFSKEPTDLVNIATTSFWALIFSILSKKAYENKRILKLIERFTKDSGGEK